MAPRSGWGRGHTPRAAQVFWTRFGWTLTTVRGSHWFSLHRLLLSCLESPNLSPTSPAASDHPARMRGEVERTGRTHSTPGSASTDLGQVTKLCTSVLICHRWREDCQTQCPVRTRDLVWPSLTGTSGEKSKLKHLTATRCLQSRWVGPALPPRALPFLCPILHMRPTVVQ